MNEPKTKTQRKQAKQLKDLSLQSAWEYFVAARKPYRSAAGVRNQLYYQQLWTMTLLKSASYKHGISQDLFFPQVSHNTKEERRPLQQLQQFRQRSGLPSTPSLTTAQTILFSHQGEVSHAPPLGHCCREISHTALP